MLLLLIRDLFFFFFRCDFFLYGTIFFRRHFFLLFNIRKKEKKDIGINAYFVLYPNSTTLEWTFCKNCEYRFRCDWGNQPTCAPLMNSAGQASQYLGDSKMFHFYRTSIRSKLIICWLQYLQIDLTYS